MTIVPERDAAYHHYSTQPPHTYTQYNVCIDGVTGRLARFMGVLEGYPGGHTGVWVESQSLRSLRVTVGWVVECYPIV
jgi:hypothetical protein